MPKPCSFPDCSEPRVGRGLCRKHYDAWRRSSPDSPRCSIAGCEGVGRLKGWCSKHYHRWRTHGDPLWERPVRLCSLEGCERKYVSSGLCQHHFSQRAWRNKSEAQRAAHATGQRARANKIVGFRTCVDCGQVWPMTQGHLKQIQYGHTKGLRCQSCQGRKALSDYHARRNGAPVPEPSGVFARLRRVLSGARHA